MRVPWPASPASPATTLPHHPALSRVGKAGEGKQLIDRKRNGVGSRRIGWIRRPLWRAASARWLCHRHLVRRKVMQEEQSANKWRGRGYADAGGQVHWDAVSVEVMLESMVTIRLLQLRALGGWGDRPTPPGSERKKWKLSVQYFMEATRAL
ncbi:hypothetical protein VTI74DRAFT_11571 [Chaetomium olivicolor]